MAMRDFFETVRGKWTCGTAQAGRQAVVGGAVRTGA
jgi:hypothetical protein